MFAAGSPDRPRHARCRASAFVSYCADCRGVGDIGSSKSTLARVLVVLVFQEPYLCDTVINMYGGKVVERGATANVLDEPKDDYPKTLISSVPCLTR